MISKCFEVFLFEEAIYYKASAIRDLSKVNKN